MLKQIRWSLFLKAVLLGAIWFIAPFWIFFLAAVYVYFVPFFRTKSLFWAFLAILISAMILERGILASILIAGSFFVLLGIKNFVIINRKEAYELLLFGTSFLFLTTASGGAATG